MFSLSRQWVQILAATALSSALAIPALAGPTPDYGHDFVTIGDPGNRWVSEEEGPMFYPPFTGGGVRVGQVNYRYRMARTEVTVGQWLNFVNSYAPYYDGPQNALQFTSQWIVYDQGQGQYRAIAGSENYAADMGWRFAARYCNWLHNDKGLDQASFENGAYDASTFTDNADGSFNDQQQHHPDARFWIPTLDEWTKGMHWDPAMNGGEGGYWRYPHSSNLAPQVGPPGEGDTNAGTAVFYDVGSYPHAMSPWGLLDGSGGQNEWLETDSAAILRLVRGSAWNLPSFFDQLDYLSGDFVSGLNGLRLASVVPSPAVYLPLLVAYPFTRPQRKETHP